MSARQNLLANQFFSHKFSVIMANFIISIMKSQMKGITDKLSYKIVFQFLQFSIFSKLVKFGKSIEEMLARVVSSRSRSSCLWHPLQHVILFTSTERPAS